MEKQQENIFENDKIVELIDKLDFIKNITHTQESTIAGIERNIDNYYESITQEDFAIIRSDKYFLLNSSNDSKEISDDNFNQNIVSMSFNKHLLFYVRNNGECYMTNGQSKGLEIKQILTKDVLYDFNNLNLKNALKLSGSLNKKYLIKVSCGLSHVVFLTHAGMVFTMGEGKFGQLGHNNFNDLNEPTMLTSLLNHRACDIAVGGDHNLILATTRDLTKKSVAGGLETKSKDQNYLLVWGDNSKGQLGLGKSGTESTMYVAAPIILEDFYIKKFMIKKIQTGLNHSLILLENGKAFAMGSNEHHQLDNSNLNHVELEDNFYSPVRVKLNKRLNHSDIHKHNVINIKCAANSTLLVTDQNYLMVKGKITNRETKIFKIKNDKKTDKSCNMITEILSVAEWTKDAELLFLFNDKILEIIYDKSRIQIIIEEIEVDSPDANYSQTEASLPFKERLRLGGERTTTHPMETNMAETNINHAHMNTDDSNFFQDFDISKEFLSDNASTNELFDNNVSFEQSIEELRNYISLVGISLVGASHNSSMSFRPKNLPRKTRQEEEYHRKLVEENRRRYKKLLKDKQEEESRLKQKMDRKKEKLRKLQEVWMEEILPNWFKKKKDYNFLKKYFYEGIPTSIRGKIWLLCIGNNFSITPEYFEIEVKKAVSILNQLQKDDNNEESDSLEIPNNLNIQTKYNINIIGEEKSIKYIDLDIERTFPYLGIFKGNSPLGEDLREILQAFVVSRPDIGYIQGMSFIAGMLLLNMDKYQAFVALMNITLSHNIIPFYRFDEHQIRKRLQIFKQIFYYNLPELCDHFEGLDILPEHYLIEWNMTLFSKNLNIDISARIWDIYMLDGVKAIYQTAIVILSHFEKKFYEMEFDSILKTLKNTNNLNFDEDQLVDLMKQVKFPEWVNQEIQKLNDEYIPIY